jgi:type II secretory pathway pseudopilin PulG
VLVIAAVLAALAGPRLLASPAFNQRGYTDELAGVLRTAEEVAYASGCDVQVTIAPSSGYSAVQPSLGPGNACSGPPIPVMREDGTALRGSPPSDADVSAGVSLVFHSNGAVTGPTSISVVGTPSGATSSLTLQVDPQSGFVTVP